MKLTRVLAWICLALGCIAIAIAETPVITGVEAVDVTVLDLDRSVESCTRIPWETLVDQDDVNASWSYLSQKHQKLISSDVEQLGERSGFMFADPDGHVLEAVSPANTQAVNLQGR
jgi:hypothetical protein